MKTTPAFFLSRLVLALFLQARFSSAFAQLAPDRFEPNDSFAQATDLGIVRRRTETGLSIHATNNYDYFKFTPAYPGSLQVDILFVDAAGDLDLGFYDAAQHLLAISCGFVDNESITWPVYPGSNYFIRVDNEWSGDTNSYDMIIAGPGPVVTGAELGSSSNTIVMRWRSATGTVYCIQQATNLVAGFNSTAAVDILAEPSINTYTVTVDSAISTGFLRVKEQ